MSLEGSAPRPKSGAAAAYAQIKQGILTGELSPGQELREASLVAETGLGRTPVRDALGRLVVEGLVEVRPRQGYRVALVTLDSVRELFEMRRVLEPAAIDLAIARATDTELHELHELAARTYDHHDPASNDQFLADNRELHTQLAALSGNERLARALGALLEETQRLYFVSFDHTSTPIEQIHEHGELFDAILTRDSDRARAIAESQINSSRQEILDHLLHGASRPVGRSGGIVLVGSKSVSNVEQSL